MIKDQQILAAIELFLRSTDKSDWYLANDTAYSYFKEGELSQDGWDSYIKMVGDRLKENDNDL